MATYITQNNQDILRQIDWVQFTPLLTKANQIIITKQKIDAKNVLTEDARKWTLSGIIWDFKPASDVKSTMTFKQLNDDGIYDSSDTKIEEFDFLSGAFKFYYNSGDNTIMGEIQVMEADLPVTYRYLISFYGNQTVNTKDFLIAQGNCASNPVKTVNSVIAL